MTRRDRTRIDDLLRRLEQLDSTTPPPEAITIHAVAREAIVDELARLAREQGLRIFRRGDTIDAVHLAG